MNCTPLGQIDSTHKTSTAWSHSPRQSRCSSPSRASSLAATALVELSSSFLAIGLPITMNVRNVYAVRDVALVIADWSLKGTGADGSEVDMSGSAAEVARRGADGWKFIVDNPFGTRPRKHVGGTAYCAGRKSAA